MKYLLVVESPSKCKIIQKYMEKNFPEHEFIIVASVGHFMELSKKNMGVDMKNNFQPTFIESKDKKSVIANLKANAKKVDRVIIATDRDNEGEKIGYDVAKLLKQDLLDNNRMIFNEITGPALKKAFENLSTINLHMVNAQLARRILDRLIGFEISKITAQEIQSGASAGRVLSTTTELIYDKSKELNDKPEDTFFKLIGNFSNNSYSLNDCEYQKDIETLSKLEKIISSIKNEDFKISKAKDENKTSSSPLPYITSTINQESPYSVKQTTSILQKLYQKGLITYIRTDSTKMSEPAKMMLKKYITTTYGENNFKYKSFNKKKVKGAQEAHECIRITNVNKLPNTLKNAHEKKIYDMIWKRSISCLMVDAKYISKDIELKNVGNTKIIFKTNLHKYTSLGWKTVYTTINELNKDKKHFDNIKVNDILKYDTIVGIQKYTSTRGRYTESKLIKKLETLGIGRPSTYASAVTNIQNKNYVIKGDVPGKEVDSIQLILENGKVSKKVFKELINEEKNKLILTKLGKTVTEYLKENFGVIMDYNFTSEVEADLDKIKDNKVKWYDIVRKYYDKFHPQVEAYKKNKPKKTRGKKEDSLIGEYKGKKFYRFKSKWGPRILYGEKGEKGALYLIPPSNKLFNELKLEDVIQLLPRTVGKVEGKDAELHFSKNLYIKWNGLNIPLHWSVKNKKKEDITLDDVKISIDNFKAKKSKKNKK